jgi:hypothetical protein
MHRSFELRKVIYHGTITNTEVTSIESVISPGKQPISRRLLENPLTAKPGVIKKVAVLLLI